MKTACLINCEHIQIKFECTSSKCIVDLHTHENDNFVYSAVLKVTVKYKKQT